MNYDQQSSQQQKNQPDTRAQQGWQDKPGQGSPTDPQNPGTPKNASDRDQGTDNDKEGSKPRPGGKVGM